MTETGKRSYASPLRAEHARHTRKRIVDAAAALFTERGYGATTIEAIAAAARVSRKTVFTSVGGKVELIKLAYDFAITGDDEPVPLRDRAAVQALVNEADPAKMLADFADLITDIAARAAPMHTALEGAAQIDSEARRLYEQIQDQRAAVMHEPAELLAARGALRPGLTVGRAADIIWLHNDPCLYDRLVRQRGWPIPDFRAWLARSLQTQLL